MDELDTALKRLAMSESLYSKLSQKYEVVKKKFSGYKRSVGDDV
jgi:hypothetical protein